MSDLDNKKRKVFQSLSGMFYDLVKVPMLAVVFNPLVSEKFSWAFVVFGSAFCVLFLYAAVILELKGEEL